MEIRYSCVEKLNNSKQIYLTQNNDDVWILNGNVSDDELKVNVLK